MPEPYSPKQLLAEFPPTGATPGGAGAAATSTDYEELAELVREVMTAESFHEPLIRLAWRYLHGGMPAGRVVETLRGLLLAVPEPHDERWQARYDEIERTVSSAVAKQLRPALDIILEWMERRYDPGHRNPDQTFYSRKLESDIPLSRIHPNREVLEALRHAIETPRDKGGVKVSQLPVVFNRFKAAAYGELLDHLLPRDATASTVAGEELAVMLTNLLACPLAIHYGGAHTASLGSLARTFAELVPEQWQRVLDLPLWGKTTSGKMWIGLRPELAARMKTCPLIAAMTPTKLSRICKQHGLIDPEITHVYDAGDGPQRAAILRPEFVATLELVNLMYDPKAAALRAWFADSQSRAGPARAN